MATDPIKALIDLEDKSKALLHELDLWQDSIHPMPLPQHLLEDAVLILKAHVAAIEALTPMAEGTSVVVPVVPTEAMLHAYQSAIKNHIRSLSTEERALLMKGDFTRIKPYEKAKIRYRAMIAASPSASTGKDEAVERVAIALHLHDFPRRPWEEVEEIFKNQWRSKSRAALAAINGEK